MTTVLLTIHILVAILLIAVVLMQRGQAGGMGESFGGGSSQSLFGSAGASSFLVKATGVLATIFMITSLSLAFFSQQEAGSVLDKGIGSGAVQESGIPATDDAIFDPKELESMGKDALPSAE